VAEFIYIHIPPISSIMVIVCIVVCLFEAESRFIVQAGLDLVILLSPLLSAGIVGWATIPSHCGNFL
jgi:hypothetical protein